MTKKKLKVNEEREIVSVPYHDYTIAELRCSKDQVSIGLKSTESAAETKLFAQKPSEYNISGIFPDSIVGEAFLFDLQELLDDNSLICRASHVIGGRLRDQDIYGFLERLNENRRYKLLLLETIDGGKISVISPELIGVTSF